ncbi:MAG TPA: hypothetical protein VEQ10_18145 [Vicinamibacteria bacterium]|nr:hypothetical protein [Vicinamibacteria bacterium]
MLKRLRDSGFPLKPISVELGKQIALERPAVVFSKSNGEGRAEAHLYYVPSLSDLVEACGDRLESMSRVPDGWECNRGRSAPMTHGPTLQDALAALWLNHGGAFAPRKRRQPAHEPDRDFTVEG